MSRGENPFRHRRTSEVANTLEFLTFAERTLKRMLECLENDEQSDLLFIVGDEERRISAHRWVVAASSPYFRQIFSVTEPHARQIELRITDVDADIFVALLKYCYTGVVWPQEHNARALLREAIKMQLKFAANTCSDFLESRITAANCFEVASFADSINCSRLRRPALLYAAKRFHEVTRTKRFFQLSPQLLTRFLDLNDLDIQSEEEVFECLMRWYRYDADGRERHLPHLMEYLRLTQLSPDFIEEHIQPLRGCDILLQNSLKWHSDPEQQATGAGLKRTQPRNIEKCVVGVGADLHSRRILRYNSDTNEWTECFRGFSIARCGFKVVFIECYFMLLGGWTEDGNHTTGDVARLNVITHELEHVQAMQIPRANFCAAVLNSRVYAIGGRNEFQDDPVNSVERWDPRDGYWCYVTALNVPRCGAAAIALKDDRLLVVGGINRTVYLRSVECYSPVTNTWTRRASMIQARILPAVAESNGYIYVLGGGYSNPSRRNTIEFYDPVNDKWKLLLCVSSERDGIGCMFFNNRLLCVGGYRLGASPSVAEHKDAEIKIVLERSITGVYHCFMVPIKLVLKMEKSALE